GAEGRSWRCVEPAEETEHGRVATGAREAGVLGSISVALAIGIPNAIFLEAVLSKIAFGMPNVRVTMIGPSELGSRCLRISFAGDEPDERAASTNSFSLMDRTWPRTRRASPTQLTSDIAPKMVSRLGWKTETTTSTNRRSGNA